MAAPLYRLPALKPQGFSSPGVQTQGREFAPLSGLFLKLNQGFKLLDFCGMAGTALHSETTPWNAKPMLRPRSETRAQSGAPSSTDLRLDGVGDTGALFQGGNSVSEVIKAMLHGLEGMDENDDFAVRVAAIATITANIDKLDGNFLLALDFMIQKAQKEEDEDRIWVLEIIKEEVLRQISQKFPSQVQVLNHLISIPDKDIRRNIFCRASSGGGYYTLKVPSSESVSNDNAVNEGGKGGEETDFTLTIPGTNLTEIIAQSDELISKMETAPKITSRKLLSRLIIIREEAKSLLADGILDARNTSNKFKNLPQAEVDFITSLMSLPPNSLLKKRLKNVIQGLDEGKDVEETEETKKLNNYERRKRFPLPVRPGMLLEAIDKLINGMYSRSGSGPTVRQLEWIKKEVMDILDEIAYGNS